MPKIKAKNRWTFRIFCGMMCGYKGGAVMAKRRPSGDGMVRKRDDGRWEGRIVVGHKKIKLFYPFSLLIFRNGLVKIFKLSLVKILLGLLNRGKGEKL